MNWGPSPPRSSMMQPQQRGTQPPVSMDTLARMSFDDMRAQLDQRLANPLARGPMGPGMFDLEPFPPRPRRVRSMMRRSLALPFDMELPPIPHPPDMMLSTMFDMESFPPIHHSHSHPHSHLHSFPRPVGMQDMSYESLMTLQDVRRGVTHPDLAKLRKMRFSNNVKCKQCGICQDNFSTGTKVITLPCEHVFCEAEILKWFETNKTCPTCRFVVENISAY